MIFNYFVIFFIEISNFFRCIIDNFINFEKVGKEDLNSTSEIHKHETWLITFSKKKFQSEFDEKFSQYYTKHSRNPFDVMRFEPMLCPPKDRSESLLDGG